MLETLRLLLTLTAMLLLPGWAVLAVSDEWRRWKGLQRWIVAVGISIAFYPVLFYGLRAVLPFLTLGPYKMGALLLACAAVVAWRMRGHWRELFAFERLEWVALAIFGMTLFTRFWIIRDHPYPAWSDSLQHALVTQLTAFQGQLPTTMEPYFPISLDQYHLGL
jgi:Mn2+/Fe2+ NRAMP family transporter